MQVTRRWLNFEGRSVAIHLAEQLVALEEAVQQLQRVGGPGASARQSLEGLRKEEAAGAALGARVGAAAAAVRSTATAGELAWAEAATVAVAVEQGDGEGEGGGGGAGRAVSTWLSQQAAQPHARRLAALQTAGDGDDWEEGEGGAGARKGGGREVVQSEVGVCDEAGNGDGPGRSGEAAGQGARRGEQQVQQHGPGCEEDEELEAAAGGVGGGR